MVVASVVCVANARTRQQDFCVNKSLSYCINHYNKQCEAKNYNACSIVGELHFEQKQYSKAKKYYEMVCDKANSKDSYQVEMIDGRLMATFSNTAFMMQLACRDLARFYYNGLGVKKDYDKAFKYFEKDCSFSGVESRSGAQSCAMVGSAYYLGKGTKEDLKLAKNYFEKSCKMESEIGCNKLGAMYEYGDGTAKNLSKAKEYYGKSCNWDYQNACDNYKRLDKVRYEKPNADNKQKANCSNKSLDDCINHYDKQCNATSYGACYEVGSLYREQEQYDKAKKYYEMVCDKANSKNLGQVKYVVGSLTWWHATFIIGVACYDLASFYYNGLGVKQDYSKALQYHKKACDLDWADSCGLVGSAYYLGKGTKEDLALAKSYFEKSCKMESEIGCYGLGEIYQFGNGVPQNLSKAKELFGRACDLGEQKGCNAYKMLNEQGVK